ncbi:DUF2254 domain-containing protein [Pararoseomonas sp. SCSIO 73927]|uniref:DUF2254 domain-containing protein n=1 Tax=Pararoseomonas sp. SCSIO 73927 TaxID=3114537 RepID=UPI0030CFC5CB
MATTRWGWLAGRLWGRLWFRGSLFSLAGVAVALAAVFLGPLLPAGASRRIGADAVGDILRILASSMLTVATFSLSTLVSAYSSATANATPRATTLLMEDSTAQNALGTFIGAFLFSLVGLIALSTGLYGEEGRSLLFLATLAVVAVVVLTLLRWIDRLPRMGRVAETMERVEEAAIAALREAALAPSFGAAPAPPGPPPGAHPIRAAGNGYIVHLDLEALERAGERLGGLQLRLVPGKLVHRGAVLAWSREVPDGAAEAAVRDAVLLGRDRSFGQDPRFGLLVLAEIGSRALSDGINDAGTAIRVLAGGLRAFDAWANPGEARGEAARYPHLAIPALDPAELVADFFRPLARDGAGNPDVMARLLKSLAALPELGGEGLRGPAEAEARRALALAEAAIALPEELEALRRLAPG